MVSLALIILTLLTSISSSLILELMRSSGPTKVTDKSGFSFKANEAPNITASGPLSEPKVSMTILYCSISYFLFAVIISLLYYFINKIKEPSFDDSYKLRIRLTSFLRLRHESFR